LKRKLRTEKYGLSTGKASFLALTYRYQFVKVPVDRGMRTWSEVPSTEGNGVMKHMLSSIAVGALLLGASVMPSAALTCNVACFGVTPGNNPNPGAFGDTTASGAFTDQFGFTLTAPPNSFNSVTNEITAPAGDFTGLTLSLYTAANVLIASTTTILTVGGNQTERLTASNLLAPGSYYIQVSATGGGTGFTGLENVSQAPLPAALPLFAGGLGLLGFYGRRRKLRGQQAA
jgi:hypothetical protein